MDPSVPTSFIPKKPLVGEARTGGGMGGLLNLLAILVFVVSLLAAGGAFAYGQYLNGAIADKDASLKKAEGAFDTRSIQDLQRLDSRLTEAETLLANHVAPSGIFTFLSATTLERVQFTSLGLDVAGDGSAKLTMNGIADSFSTLALQSDEFSTAKVLKDVIFSGITTDATGHVVFSVSANVDPTVISYAKQNNAAVSQAPQGSTQN
ncbi:MAG TPA: hypothetical protein VGP13_00580 [Candidatus Paceibacterota bacterium]|jgi:hypothetical protein|nr:hypothetical protein [Candidatus Paceibacterota bacterium]